jgi:hypothetical protein
LLWCGLLQFDLIGYSLVYVCFHTHSRNILHSAVYSAIVNGNCPHLFGSNPHSNDNHFSQSSIYIYFKLGSSNQWNIIILCSSLHKLKNITHLHRIRSTSLLARNMNVQSGICVMLIQMWWICVSKWV